MFSSPRLRGGWTPARERRRPDGARLPFPGRPAEPTEPGSRLNSKLLQGFLDPGSRGAFRVARPGNEFVSLAFKQPPSFPREDSRRTMVRSLPGPSKSPRGAGAVRRGLREFHPKTLLVLRERLAAARARRFLSPGPPKQGCHRRAWPGDQRINIIKAAISAAITASIAAMC